MALPVLDQDSYSAVCSEWVAYAGDLLRHQGYLRTDPTGIYDDEFAVAVDEFQLACGIGHEPRQIGPYTWAALGVQDPDLVAVDSGADPWAAPDEPAPAATFAADPGLEVFTGGKRYIIFSDEVRSGGTISWRARNPGNIRNGEHYGAYPGKKANTKSAGSFAVFPDEATGFAAIAQVLRGYGHITVAQAMAKYAPAGDGANDPDAYARSVARQMGVAVDTYIDALDDAQMAVFSTAIQQVEGWTVGTTNALDDESLPDAVKQAIRGQ
jgi:hypothetical protein